MNAVPETVLVVDDNETALRLMRAILRGAGVKDVRVTGDPTLALKDLAESPPDLIFVDWKMKPVNGVAFVREVRASADPRVRHIPIIMVTGHTEKSLVKDALAAGVSDFLVKPVSPKLVTERMQAVLGRVGSSPSPGAATIASSSD